MASLSNLGLAALVLSISAACASAIPPPAPEAMSQQTPAQQAFQSLQSDLAAAGADAEPVDFIEAFADAMFQDLPFKTDARYGALERLTKLATDPAVSTAQTLDALQSVIDQEIGYGQSIGHWQAEIAASPDAPTRHTHYGRLAMTRETPGGAECYDMATLTFLPARQAQISALEARITAPSDLTPENLPIDWPCAYLPDSDS